MRFLLPAVFVPLLLINVHAAEAPQPQVGELREAREITQLLQEGRVAEGLAQSQKSVRARPESSLLRTRLAQARICEAVDLDLKFDSAIDDARSSWMMAFGIRFLEEPFPAADKDDPARDQQRLAAQVEMAEVILTPANRAAISVFQESARKRLSEVGPVLEGRTAALQEARKVLGEARDLGERSIELELTDLWLKTLVPLWREEIRRLRQPDVMPGGRTGPRTGAVTLPYAQGIRTLDAALTPFSDVTPDKIREQALSLCDRYPNDPEALAGVADILTVLGDLSAGPDPVHRHVKRRLEWPWLTGAGVFAVEPDAPTRKLYDAGQAEPDADGGKFAALVKPLQLYERAQRLDPKGELRYLGLRLYTMRAVFDAEKATSLIRREEGRDPQNGAVFLSKAHVTALLKREPVEAIAEVRRAAGLRKFDRSFLVAAPEPLRNALSLQPVLRDLVNNGSPGFGDLFGSLKAVEHPTVVQGNQRVLGPPSDAETIIAAIRLRLDIAELLCRAPDYRDRALGIDEKTGALEDILKKLKDRAAGEQAPWVQALDLHRRRYADFPAETRWVKLHGSGFVLTRSPRLNPDPDLKPPYASLSGAFGIIIPGVAKRP